MTKSIIRVMCLFVAMAVTTVQCQQFLRRPQRFDRNLDNTDTSSSQQQFPRQQQSNGFRPRTLDNRRGQFTSEFYQPPRRGPSLSYSRSIRPQTAQMQRDDFPIPAVGRRPLDEWVRSYRSRQQFQQPRLDPQSPEEIYPSRSRSDVQSRRRLSGGQDSRIDGRERFARIYPGEREPFTNRENVSDRRFISNRQSSLSQERNPRRQTDVDYSPQTFASGLRSRKQPATFVNERSGNFPASVNDGFSPNIRNQDSYRGDAWPSSRGQQQERTTAQRQIEGEYLQQQQLEKERDELLQQKRKNEKQLRRGRIMLHQQQEKDQLLQQQLRGNQPQLETGLQGRNQSGQPEIALQGRDQTEQPQTALQGRDQPAQPQTALQGRDQPAKPQTALQKNEQLNVTITPDPAQAKQERIQQLADLLGFRHQDLHNAVTELEASRSSLDALAKTGANALAKTGANASAKTGADILTTDTSSAFSETSTPPPHAYTTDINRSSTMLTDIYTDTTSSTGLVNDIAATRTIASSSPEPASVGHIASGPSHLGAHKAASDSPTTSRNHNEMFAVQTPSGTEPRDSLLAAATEAMIAEIHKMLGLNKSLAASSVGTNSSAPEKNVTAPISNSTEFLDMSAMHASPEFGAPSPFLFALNETIPLNSTAVTPDFNVTMAMFTNSTESTNTTAAPVEVTEAVPTPPPPPPGFPHMFEPLPGQELTEAQLEYNEMREALMP